jgi:hypothetical protein
MRRIRWSPTRFLSGATPREIPCIVASADARRNEHNTFGRENETTERTEITEKEKRVENWGKRYAARKRAPM